VTGRDTLFAVRALGCITLLVSGCADSVDDAEVCDQAETVLETCGHSAEQSPFGTCQPDQREIATTIVTEYEDGGCSALTAGKADSALCAKVQFLCVDHSPAELKPFVSDGCSMFPDGVPGDPTRWQSCCIAHDLAYYVGGREELKAAADRQFGACVAAAASPLLGELMQDGVEIGGTPALPTPWRWGYGWDYDPLNGYRDLPADQLAAATREVNAYKANPVAPDGYEQRARVFWASIADVPGLRQIMDAVDSEIDSL
jgi:hypothetical protein